MSFRYAETEPFVLENVNLTSSPGEFVAITGPSGGGKTTLAKVMLGLLEPTGGEVVIDGTPLSTLGAQTYREHVAAVMQDDQLLSGSIADNICFFDPAFDMEWMIECARRAGIHDEIMAMPMTYNSLIGDMGSSLSGGQKQRVLLARALYRRPKILVPRRGHRASRRRDGAADQRHPAAAADHPHRRRAPSRDDQGGRPGCVT